MHRTKAHSLLMIGILSLLTASVLTSSGLAADRPSQADYPLGVFNFDFARLGANEVSQISKLRSIGYRGLVLNLTNPKALETLKQYQSAIGNQPFKVYAGYVAIDFSKNMGAQNAHIDRVIKHLKRSDARLWVILRVRGGKKVTRKQIVDFLRATAKRAKAGGVELVIYPHFSGGNPLNVCLIESAEDAIPYVKEVGSDNLFISLHLCHEIKAGNGDRLNDVASKVKPWLRLPSINGADVDSVNEQQGWKRGIQPLTEGDYDPLQLLKALHSIGYEGPVILHTWGLQEAAADHHQTSFERFQELLDELGRDK